MKNISKEVDHLLYFGVKDSLWNSRRESFKNSLYKSLWDSSFIWHSIWYPIINSLKDKEFYEKYS